MLLIEFDPSKADNDELQARMAELEGVIATKEAEIAEHKRLGCSAVDCRLRQPT